MATKSRSKSRTNHSKPFTMLGDTLESAAESFEEATVNANHSAKRAAQATKRALGTGLFKAVYGVSYGLVYSGVFVRDLLPEGNCVRKALSEGAESALDSRAKARTASVAKKAAAPKAAAKKPAAKAKTAKAKSKIPARVRKAVNKRAADFEGAAATA